jgi:hypothetical protein
MAMRRPGKQGANSLKANRTVSFAKRPTISAPDPVAFAAAAKAIG